jgi:hypothetical protein
MLPRRDGGLLLTAFGSIGLLLSIAGTVLVLRNGLPGDEVPAALPTPGRVATSVTTQPITAESSPSPDSHPITQITPTPPPAPTVAPPHPSAPPAVAVAPAQPSPLALPLPTTIFPPTMRWGGDEPVFAGPRD